MGTLDITITGWLGGEVTHLPAKDGKAAYSTFRLGSTRRWWNRAEGRWEDGRTEWFQVKMWRALAGNVAQCLHKGMPVVVHGRLATREWQDEGGAVRTSLVIDAHAVGIDLSFGSVERFQRTLQGPAAQAPDEERREPVDLSSFVDAPDEELVPSDEVLDDLESERVSVSV
ncbi:single-stranded DNA-binding protein [Cellulomonas composti]|uniref:Single-stranded DNA-binding protein n=1 Tax=Cellulomonas composti TaxID=266130 RepID=A0A511J9S4_9CELL|nr:single-stranded DNA-binding protein [Cellulomonas composti]GEL94741.1 hypothetical protein CCO02nite_13990 [Cellulomonas composti]